MTFAFLVVCVIIIQMVYAVERRDHHQLYQANLQDAPMDFMEDKWKTIFKASDLSHDKILDRVDLQIQQNVYIQLYKLNGIEEERIKEQLSSHWDCMTLGGLGDGLTMVEFVARHKESYIKDEEGTVNKIHKCVVEFVSGIVDHDKDRFVSVNELYAVLAGLDKGNRKLAQERMDMICPGIQTRCPVDTVVDFYTELHIGDNKEKYNLFQNSYRKVGMPLEDQVE